MRYIAIPTKALTKVRGAEKPCAVVTGTSRGECRRIIVMCGENLEEYTIFTVDEKLLTGCRSTPRIRNKLTTD